LLQTCTNVLHCFDAVGCVMCIQLVNPTAQDTRPNLELASFR